MREISAVNPGSPNSPTEEPEREPGRFCTHCGTFNLSHHRFCDHCGLPMPQARIDGTGNEIQHGRVPAADSARPVEPGQDTVPMPRHLRWLAPGAALCCLLVASLAAVIWQAAAPPPTSEEVFKALRSAGAQIAEPSSDLLCMKNLPYHRHHIQVQPTDTSTREWLDSLVLAGLYAPGVEVVPDEVSDSTLIQYQTLPALNSWRRNGKLCVAQGWELESVRTYAVPKSSETDSKRYMAALSWRAKAVAPWFAQLPPMGSRWLGVERDDNGLSTTTQQALERVSGRWTAVQP